MSRTFPLALLLGVALAAPAAAQTADASGPSVIVTEGRAVLKRAPDQAWVTIAAETRAQTPAEAQRLAAEAMTAVNAALSSAGIAATAVRTTGYSLRPDMQVQDGRQRVRGYIARNQVEVRVDDLSTLGGVIDAAGTSGATNMSGLRFDLKDRTGVEREALRMAVEDAIGRANAMASGASQSIGRILRIDEHRGSPDMPRPMMTMRADAGFAQVETPISPGEIEIAVSVTVTAAVR